MPTIFVTSVLPGDGKSVVAAGVAAGLRAAGSTVRLARATGAAHSDADADAATFAAIQGVRSSGTPVDPAQVESDADLTVIELDTAEAAARQPADLLVLVTRHGEADDVTLQRAVELARPSALVINAAPPEARDQIAEHAAGLGVPLLAVLPQDRLLAAPSFAEMAAAVGGSLAGPERLRDDAPEWLVVGPISAHGGMPYFDQFPHQAVVTRHDRVDIALGALNQRPAGLILTGGEPTLPYVGQRAEREEFALIVTGQSTVDAVNSIGALYDHSSFQGPRKLQRAIDLIAEHASLALLRASAPA